MLRRTVGILLAGTVCTTVAHAQSIVRIDGSSSVFPLVESVAREFQVQSRGSVRVAVRASGTRGGFRRFCSGETDIQNASRPIQREELDACRRAGVAFVELPVAYDAVAIVVHPSNDWLRQISTTQLARLWDRRAEGRIVRWNQLEPGWPDRPIALFGPGEDSGTRDFFIDAVLGPAGAIRRDFAGSEDDEQIVAAIATQPDGIGILPHGYAIRDPGKVRVLPVAHAGRAPVEPSSASVEQALYRPLSRPLFLYVAEPSLRRPEARQFAEFLFVDAKRRVEAAAFIPLPPEGYRMALERLMRGRLGTAFGGQPELASSIDTLLGDEVAN